MYWVLGRYPWNRRIFDEVISKFPGEWHFVSSPDELTLEAVQQDDPEKLFFMHWSWKVPKEITDNYECIAFHPTDLPYGRGGSPIQNLIERQYETTKISAFRMIDEIDAGPVYLKYNMALHGTAEEIYCRMSLYVAYMIDEILREDLTSIPQKSKTVTYKRRTPPMSRVPVMGGLDLMYDHIRMLDAEGYPRAFLIIGNYRYEFSHALMYDNRIEAHVTITKVDSDAIS